MRQVLLTDICRPKQWKTLSTKNLKTEGYPVYGANGIIGYYNEYTHGEPTILITCRGATCGTINVCVPKSYVNGNAMALDNLSPEIDLNFLSYYLSHRGLNDVISGSAQPQITRQNLNKVKVPLPPLEEQKKIAAILDAADDYRQKTKALIDKYDQLTQSLFLDMFGDPVTNPKGWEIKTLNDVCAKITDGEHGTVKRLNSGKPYLMARNVGHDSIVLDEVAYISQEDHERIYKRCKPEAGDLLLVCVGATIGRCCLVPFDFDEFSLARSVALIKPNIQFNSLFLLHHFKDLHFQNEIQNSRNTSAQAGLYTGQIKKLKVSVPAINLQNQFADRVQAIEAQKAQAQVSLTKAEELFNSLLQKAFKGELTN